MTPDCWRRAAPPFRGRSPPRGSRRCWPPSTRRRWSSRTGSPTRSRRCGRGATTSRCPAGSAEPSRRAGTQIGRRLDWVGTQFSKGSNTIERLVAQESGDLGYVVQLEHLRYTVPGQAQAVDARLPRDHGVPARVGRLAPRPSPGRFADDEAGRAVTREGAFRWHKCGLTSHACRHHRWPRRWQDHPPARAQLSRLCNCRGHASRHHSFASGTGAEPQALAVGLRGAGASTRRRVVRGEYRPGTHLLRSRCHRRTGNGRGRGARAQG